MNVNGPFAHRAIVFRVLDHCVPGFEPAHLDLQVPVLNSRRNSPDFNESGHQRLSVRLAELIPDAEVRVLPPQPASPLSSPDT